VYAPFVQDMHHQGGAVTFHAHVVTPELTAGSYVVEATVLVARDGSHRQDEYWGTPRWQRTITVTPAPIEQPPPPFFSSGASPIAIPGEEQVEQEGVGQVEGSTEAEGNTEAEGSTEADTAQVLAGAREL